MDVTCQERRDAIENALNKHKIPLDMKNELILQYIYLGEGAIILDPDLIARSLAEQRFLSNFCDVDKGIEMAKNQCVGVRVARERWVQRVKKCILEVSGYHSFPEIWPWLHEGDETDANIQYNKSVARLYFCKQKHTNIRGARYHAFRTSNVRKFRSPNNNRYD